MSFLKGNQKFLWPAALFFLVSFTYAVTADYSFNTNVDSQAAALPAWKFATHGTLEVHEFKVNPWIREFEHGWYSDRPPGIVLAAVPAYLLFGAPKPTIAPATATAVLAASCCVLLIFLVLRTLLSEIEAFWGSLIFAFCTQTWGVSANELWQHGPAQLWLALGLYLSMRGRNAAAGAAFGLALFTRPITGLIPLFFGLINGHLNRSALPMLRVWLGAGIFIAALLAVNFFVYAQLSVMPSVAHRYFENFAHVETSSYFMRIYQLFLGPENGVLIWSPFLFILLGGSRRAWSKAAPWVKSALLSGLLFAILHVRFNRASGGVPFGYRYPLEMLVMIAPFCALCYKHWVTERKFRAFLFLGTCAVSAIMHCLIAVRLHCDEYVAGQVLCSLR